MIAESTNWSDPLTVATIALFLATFGLFAATFLLAWSTRRIARSSAQEVRAMTRPMLLPARDAEERVATSERTMSPGTPINTYHVVQVPIRNAGSGPALGAALATALPSVDPWQAMEFVSAIAVDDEVVVEVPVFGGSGGGLPPSVTLYIQYGDLGGATYATNIELHLAAGATKRVGRVDLVEGKALYRQIFPSTKPNLTRYRRPPLGPRLRAAADRLFLKPGDPIEPLRPRIRSAWAAIRPPRRQSYVQRFRWALQADRMNRGPGGPYSGTPIHAQYAAMPLSLIDCGFLRALELIISH